MFEFQPQKENSLPLFNDEILRYYINERIYKNIISYSLENLNQLEKSSRKIARPEPKSLLPERNMPKITKKAFQQRVAQLQQLGFERKLCVKALKAAAFNITRATDYLLENNIPSTNFSTTQEIREKESLIVSSVKPEEIESESCIFTSVQKEEFIHMNKHGFDIETSLQVYIACNKQKEVAENCLNSMSMC